MGFENIKQDFPQMPMEIRTMIRKEVDKQLKTETPKHRNRIAVRRTLAASLAAAMLCGLTVFAGVHLYRMQLSKTGEHGVNVTVTGQEGAEASPVIPRVKLEVGYLPEGMVQTEPGKYSFADSLAQGGVSMIFYRMDTGDDQFEVRHGDVLASEEFAAGAYQGIYLEYPDLYEDAISFNQRIYVAYTDVHYVMEMYAASDLSKEEALKIAESVKLIPTEETSGQDLVSAQDWSQYQEGSDLRPEGEGCETITSVAAEEMNNTHKVGDSFPIGDQGLTGRIAEVKIADDLSLLDAARIDGDLQQEINEDGKLRPATIQYINQGDTDTLSQEVTSREAPQKLFYAAVEYTNTGREELTDVLFFGSLARIRETDGQMQIIQEETPASGDAWETAVNHGLSAYREMIYYDVRGGERDNNYIETLKPGETVTVHMAWIVLEEELPTLYLSLDPSGGSYEFSDSSLNIGYVDVRQ